MIRIDMKVAFKILNIVPKLIVAKFKVKLGERNKEKEKEKEKKKERKVV